MTSGVQLVYLCETCEALVKEFLLFLSICGNLQSKSQSVADVLQVILIWKHAIINCVLLALGKKSFQQIPNHIYQNTWD